MKRLSLLFALLTLLVGPAAANKPAKTITGFWAYAPPNFYTRHATGFDYLDQNGASCVADGAYLRSFDIRFRQPEKQPETYLIRWTGRKNGTFRSMEKSNGKLSGHMRIKHRHTNWWGSERNRIAGVGHPFGPQLAVPAGQPIKVKIRALYADGSKGPYHKIVINTQADIDSEFLDQDTYCNA